MGKKYIYGKRYEDNPFLVRENEFHFLCKYLGAYLKYEKEKNFYNDFEDYLRKNSIKEFILHNICWGYLNEAQKYIREKLNNKEKVQINPTQSTKNHIFSRREIRKLGYYYPLSTPAMPKSACEIETELFETVFQNDRFSEVAICFLDYIFQSWKINENKSNYYSCENENALNVTTTYFIGFQQRVINDNIPKYNTFFRKFKTNPGYEYIQKGLDNRNI